MLFKILLPMAVFGYIWLLLTLLSGLRVIKVNYRVHRIFGIISIILATLHAVVMIYLNYWR